MGNQRGLGLHLNFKHSIEDPYGLLSSWVGNNCCLWERIHCDSSTESVDSLHLGGDWRYVYVGRGLYYEYVGEGYLVGDEVNSSLAELRHLKYLDLSWNLFGGSRIPHFIGSFKQLNYLNLSDSGFQGIVPHQIGNLSNLKVLDLSWNYNLRADDMAWTSGLSLLEHLDLSGLNLSRAKNLDAVLYMIPSLKELTLSDCGLSNANLGPFSNSSRILPNLKHLNLSFNSFKGPVPLFLQNMTSLAFLDLSHFNTSLAWNFASLLNMLPSLSELYMSFCGLEKTFLSSLHLNISMLSNIHHLDLRRNSIEGTFPSFFTNMTSLTVLHLSYNQLNGTVPVSVGQLAKLRSLDISYNSLEGVVYEAHFAKLSMLKELDASYNSKLTFNVSPEWIPPFQLETLYLSSCKIANGFPQWLRNQTKLKELMMSNASISGPLPTWLQKMPIIPYLDLSHKKLIGPLTNLPNEPTLDVYPADVLLLKNNLFNESIPRSLCTRIHLQVLDLSRNRLTGKIPNCLGNLQNLNVMIFSSNRLSGAIPGSMALNLSSLIWLNLNDNKLSGELPQELGNLQTLQVLDLGDNSFFGYIPWIGRNFTDLVVLRLHNNNFTGRIPRSLCEISTLQILDVAYNKLMGTIPRFLGQLDAMVMSNTTPDFRYLGSVVTVIQVMKGVELEYTTIAGLVFNMDLSSNKLVGEIPVELTNLSMLVGLNLSNNHLSGGIPNDIGNMTRLFSLDVSGNQLTGKIPPSMATLTFLSHLNMSDNNLWGQIPIGRQLQTLTDPSIYGGNKDLCGFPLPNKCSKNEDRTRRRSSKKKEEAGDDEPVDEWLFYVFITSGFGTGLWGVIGVLLFKKEWRWKLFVFAEETMDMIYVAVMGRVAKIKRGREAA